MEEGWLKRYLPRGIYGRAALIVITPIVVLVLVVSAVIIQRQYEGVTRQMTEAVAAELALLRDLRESGEDEMVARIAARLGLRLLAPEEAPQRDRLVFYDLSGREVVRTLRARLEGVRAVDLARAPNGVLVAIEAGGAGGALVVEIPRRRITPSNPHQLIAWALFTGLLMAGVAIVFLRNQLRPIRRLGVAAEAFGRGQVVPYRVAGASEVRAAGRAFLAMRSRIERHLEQRTLLLSGVSHDLRTPLTRMRLQLSMMEGEEAEALLRDVEEMQRVLEAFLDFVRTGQQEEPEETELVAFLAALAEDAERGGRRIERALPEHPVPTAVRPVSLRRAVGNLLSNALRHGARVRLGLEQRRGGLAIVVEDDGPGIPEARRAEATRPFTRLDSARSPGRGGTGLGLAIAADVARLHGGQLVLEQSRDLGGLRAEILLPGAQASQG